MIKAVRDEMYDYPVLTPEDYNNYETRLYLGQGSCHWHYTFPASRWAKTEAPLLEKIPKLEGFVDSPPYGRVSIGKAPAGEILDAIEAQALEKKICLVDDDYHIEIKDEDGVHSVVEFTDIEKAFGFREGIPSEIPKVLLHKIPKGEIRPYQSYFRIPTYRGGHDGIANGGSYGWYRTIWSDGKITIRKDHATDKSWSQHGHRLNYHNEEYESDVEISGGSWAVILHRYHGLIYDHPDAWEYYGPAPDNFRKYPKEII